MDFIEVNGVSYKVIRLLGKGKGGYSYLACGEQGNCVVKQIHHEPCDYYTFGNKLASELKDYKRLLDLGITMPRLLDVDEQNERLVKRYIEGPTVYELALGGKVPQYCFDKIREFCAVLYKAELNIDFFPTNFIPQGDELYYVDYECSDYMQQWDFEHWGIKYWSRTPELLEYEQNRKKG